MRLPSRQLAAAVLLLAACSVALAQPKGRIASREKSLTTVPWSPDDRSITLSPDGQSAAYVHQEDGRCRVIVMRDGEELRDVTCDFVSRDSLLFSPDSAHIIYVAREQGLDYVV